MLENIELEELVEKNKEVVEVPKTHQYKEKLSLFSLEDKSTHDEELQSIEKPGQDPLVLTKEQIEHNLYFVPYLNQVEITKEDIKCILAYCQENLDSRNPFTPIFGNEDDE